MQELSEPDPHLISYLTLRKALGALGIALPVILPIGVWIAGEEFQPSISKYYYTTMADVYVGILWAFGLFLFTYKGYKTSTFLLSDNTVTNIAGFLAVTAALFPTNPVDGLTDPKWIAIVHLVSAGLFFAILGLTSIFIFSQSPEPSAKAHNVLHKVCGFVIIACLLVLVLYFFWFKKVWSAYIVYWLETVMLWAFGISWLTKGKVFR